MLKHTSGLVLRRLLRGASALALCLALTPIPAMAQKKLVKIGFVGPLTGGTASIGLGARNSFLLAVQERNAGKDTKYRKIERRRYHVTWSHDAEAIRYDARCDGIFPLVTNRRKDTTKEILQVYKFQPRLERRHSQLKSVYDVAPVFLKNPERIEAMLFLYFLALLIDGLIERHVRAAMKDHRLPSIPIYPENRACRRPTADKIYDLLRDVRLHRVTTPGNVQHIPDELSDTQDQVIQLLGLTRSQFFETPR